MYLVNIGSASIIKYYPGQQQTIIVAICPALNESRSALVKVYTVQCTVYRTELQIAWTRLHPREHALPY